MSKGGKGDGHSATLVAFAYKDSGVYFGTGETSSSYYTGSSAFAPYTWTPGGTPWSDSYHTTGTADITEMAR